MADQKGTSGLYFGIPTGTKITISSTDFTVLRSFDYTPEADEVETPALNGNIVNDTHYNRSEKITVEAAPSGTTKAAAVAAALLLPQPGDLVTVASTDDTQVNGGNQWLVERATKRYAPDAMAVFTLELRRFAANLAAIT